MADLKWTGRVARYELQAFLFSETGSTYWRWWLLTVWAAAAPLLSSLWWLEPGHHSLQMRLSPLPYLKIHLKDSREFTHTRTELYKNPSTCISTHQGVKELSNMFFAHTSSSHCRCYSYQIRWTLIFTLLMFENINSTYAFKIFPSISFDIVLLTHHSHHNNLIFLLNRFQHYMWNIFSLCMYYMQCMSKKHSLQVLIHT